VDRFVERTWNHSCVRHLLIAAPTLLTSIWPTGGDRRWLT